MTEPPKWPDDTLSDMLMRAEAGDKLDAQELLGWIAQLLSPENRHPSTGDPLPVPIPLRTYLAKAFYAMATGTAPGRALHLKKSGGQQWRFHEKVLAADQVAQLVKRVDSVDEACALAAELIKSYQVDHRTAKKRGQVPFRDRTISEQTLKDWYYEVQIQALLRKHGRL